MLEIYIYFFVGDMQWNFWEVMEQHVKNVLSNGSVKKVLHTIFQLLSELKLFQNKKINKIKLRKIMLFPLVGGSVPWHRLATCAMGHLSLNTMTSLWPPKPRAFLPVLRVTLSTFFFFLNHEFPTPGPFYYLWDLKCLKVVRERWACLSRWSPFWR